MAVSLARAVMISAGNVLLVLALAGLTTLLARLRHTSQQRRARGSSLGIQSSRPLPAVLPGRGKIVRDNLAARLMAAQSLRRMG